MGWSPGKGLALKRGTHGQVLGCVGDRVAVRIDRTNCQGYATVLVDLLILQEIEYR